MEPKKSPAWEATKAIVRQALLAGLPIGLEYFHAINTWWGIVIWALLVGVDRYIHVSDKTPMTGLIPV